MLRSQDHSCRQWEEHPLVAPEHKQHDPAAVRRGLGGLLTLAPPAHEGVSKLYVLLLLL